MKTMIQVNKLTSAMTNLTLAAFIVPTSALVIDAGFMASEMRRKLAADSKG